MFCPKCGTENLSDAKFCKKCGKNLKEMEATTPKYKSIPMKMGEKGWWKKQTLPAKILIGILGIFLLAGVIMVVNIIVQDTTPIDPLPLDSGVTNDVNTSLFVDFEDLDEQHPGRVIINGTTMPEATVTLNNQSITLDSEGRFSYPIDNIHVGTNRTFTLVAKAPGRKPRTAYVTLSRKIITEDGVRYTQTSFSVVYDRGEGESGNV